MQELTAIDLTTIIISVTAITISIAVFIDSRIKEGTRKEENMIDAVSQCYTLLEEAIRMHPNLDYPVGFVMKEEFADEINRKADSLTRLSWGCREIGVDIRKSAMILKSMVQVWFAADNQYLSNKERLELLQQVIKLRDKVTDYLNDLYQ